MRSRWLAAVAGAAHVLDLLLSSLYVISEGEQALVVRLGAPVEVVETPGLKVKVPFIDTVYVTSTRSLLLEPQVEQAIMGDQKRLEVQPYARYRIVDPLRFYQALKNPEAANVQLGLLVSSAARRALGQAPLRALLTDERGKILDAIRTEVADKAAPLGVKVAFTPLGILVALIFVGLPFVVRTVEPVLADLDPEQEQAAASLGASRWQTLTKVILPSLLPAILTGFALAFARAVGEYGSVIFIAGNIPNVSEIAPLLIIIRLEEFRYADATAIATIMLVAAFVMLLVINRLQRWTETKG